MFKAILYLLFAVILISLLRGVIGIIFKGFTSLANPKSSPAPREAADNQVPLSGELKKDPACGTYISAATSLKETVGGQTFYFCSKQCRDKYVASLAR
jgi:YHS domain-containing protein